MEVLPEYVLFFDGHCNLCNASVQFVLRNDRRAKCYMASLQSKLAKTHVPESIQSGPESLVFKANNTWYTQSDAVLQLCKVLGGRLYAAYMLCVWIPKFVRNPVYTFIARNRYRWFGKTEKCLMPKPEWQQRFLAI